MDLEVAGKAAESHTQYINGYKFCLFLPLGGGDKKQISV